MLDEVVKVFECFAKHSQEFNGFFNNAIQKPDKNNFEKFMKKLLEVTDPIKALLAKPEIQELIHTNTAENLAPLTGLVAESMFIYAMGEEISLAYQQYKLDNHSVALISDKLLQEFTHSLYLLKALITLFNAESVYTLKKPQAETKDSKDSKDIKTTPHIEAKRQTNHLTNTADEKKSEMKEHKEHKEHKADYDPHNHQPQLADRQQTGVGLNVRALQRTNETWGEWIGNHKLITGLVIGGVLVIACGPYLLSTAVGQAAKQKVVALIAKWGIFGFGAKGAADAATAVTVTAATANTALTTSGVAVTAATAIAAVNTVVEEKKKQPATLKLG